MVTRETAIKTEKLFISDCQLAGLTFSKVLLFGSVAKGTAHDWSDIDLLLVSGQFTDNVFENLKLYAKITGKNSRSSPEPKFHNRVAGY
jgi:predicted nucleotidyltransferase